MALSPGDTAPDFALTAHDGSTVTLAQQRGRSVVVYFYPAAMTPGCTTQACDFRDSLPRLTSAGFTVLGISPDAPQQLASFVERDHLTFPLLSDPNHTVADAYGAWGEKTNYGKSYEGLIRSTIVVDPQGVVQLTQYNVKATGHVARLATALGLD